MYLINSDKLEPGDIILKKSESEISQLVRRLTNSKYSHAILYVGVSSCIDSDGYGVQSNNIQRIIFEKSDDAIVLRLKDQELKQQHIDDVINFARQRIGTEYSTKEAKLALLKKELDAKEPNRQFCTRFVAQAYNSAGIKLTQNPNYCIPEELLNSSYLKVVPNTSRQASQKEVEFAKSENPLARQAEIHNIILRKCRELSGQDIQTFGQINQLVISHPEYDAEITKTVKDSGYLNMMEEDIERNPWHYDAQKMIDHYKIPEVIINTALFFAETESTTRERLLMTIHAISQLNKEFPRQYFQTEIELYQKLIKYSYQREDAALQVLKHF